MYKRKEIQNVLLVALLTSIALFLLHSHPTDVQIHVEKSAINRDKCRKLLETDLSVSLCHVTAWLARTNVNRIDQPTIWLSDHESPFLLP